MAFFGKWKMKLLALKVPVVRFANDAHTIEFMGNLVKRSNSLIEPWSQKGYEIPQDVHPVQIIINGKSEIGYAVDEAGVAINFQRDINIVKAPSMHEKLRVPSEGGDDLQTPKYYVNYSWEGILGRLATLDDIAEGLDLGKSPKQLIIGIVVGIVIGYFLTAAMH